MEKFAIMISFNEYLVPMEQDILGCIGLYTVDPATPIVGLDWPLRLTAGSQCVQQCASGGSGEAAWSRRKSIVCSLPMSGLVLQKTELRKPFRAISELLRTMQNYQKPCYNSRTI